MLLDEAGEESDVGARDGEIASQQAVDAVGREGEGGDAVRVMGDADGGVLPRVGEGGDERGAAGGDPACADAGHGVGF